MSIAQAGVGFAAASQQANEQNAYYERNRQASLAAMRDRYASINNNTLQEREAASMELFEKNREALLQRAQAMTAAGEAGVTGLSVNALYRDQAGQQARRVASIMTNYNIKKQRNEDEAIATYHNTIGRINSVRQAASPSAAGFILQGIGGALGAFSRPGTTTAAA